MEQRKYKVLRDFVQYPNGRLYKQGNIYESTNYTGSPYISAMKKYGFIAIATVQDIKDAKRQARRLALAKKRVEEWKHSI